MKEMARWHSTTLGLAKKAAKLGMDPDRSFKFTKARDMISRWPNIVKDPR